MATDTLASADDGIQPRRILWQTALAVLIVWRLKALLERERA